MNRAVELAQRFGGVLVTINDISAFAALSKGRTYQAVVMPLDQVEANYHAARAEALREAAEWLSTFKKQVDSDWGKGYQTATEDTVRGLRAMAEREGK